MQKPSEAQERPDRPIPLPMLGRPPLEALLVRVQVGVEAVGFVVTQVASGMVTCDFPEPT
jgi:hypothetical protein